MTLTAIDNKAIFKDYANSMAGQPKTEELLDRFITDESLKEHIRQCEAAFPGYDVLPQQIVAEGDWIACRMTFKAIHRGEFAGIPPTGRHVSSDFMIFYRFEGGRIAEHHMQLDMQDILRQLTA